MIKLKELLGLQKMVYTETIKPKHKKRFTRPTPNFHEDLQLPYSLGFTLKPDNDSKQTLQEVKHLSKIKPNENVVLKYEEVKDVWKPYAEELGIGKYIDDVLHESVKFVMKLKYHYNRPRPYQIAEFYGINLNGTKTDSMKTPSYPSGHAIQGYLVAEILASRNPSNAQVYHEIGEAIAHSRIIGKAHYPSDKHFGKKVAKTLYKGLK
tara:strand:+ start:3025 stop:3648 length:624 start_codon:yes stop_codon:yes gene_type:complete